MQMVRTCRYVMKCRDFFPAPQTSDTIDSKQASNFISLCQRSHNAKIRNASSAIYDIWKISPQFLSLYEFNFMFVFNFHFFARAK